MRRFLYRYFRSLSSVQYWLRRRFTKAGLLVLGALLASAVLGLDTSRTMAYQAFTLLLGLIVVSIVSSLWFRAKLSIERLVPRCAAVGQPLSYRIRVYNKQGRPLPGLILLENLADPRPSFGPRPLRIERCPSLQSPDFPASVFRSSRSSVRPRRS